MIAFKNILLYYFNPNAIQRHINQKSKLVQFSLSPIFCITKLKIVLIIYPKYSTKYGNYNQ